MNEVDEKVSSDELVINKLASDEAKLTEVNFSRPDRKKDLLETISTISVWCDFGAKIIIFLVSSLT